MDRKRRWVVALGLLIAVAAGGLVVRLDRVHDYGWELTLFPSAAPPKIRFEGRDYRRGGEEPGGVPRGHQPQGETLGGGEIYESSTAEGTSTLIFVKDGSRVLAYGLMGGP